MGARIRNLFNDEAVKEALDSSKREDGSVNYKCMSNILSDKPMGVYVSPELCRYWAMQFDKTTTKGGYFKTLSKANEDIKKSIKLRKPSRYDDKAKVELPYSENKSILVIPDLHAPYHHPDTIDFLYAVASACNVDTVVSLGDEADKHAMSFHNSDPNLDSAGVELEKAREFLNELHDLFPVMRICHSNHGSMHYRKANAHGIPVQYIRTYREVLFPESGGDQWDWSYEHLLELPDGSSVLFRHQPAGSALATAAHEGYNVVVGHLHGKFDIEYAASSNRLYWGVQSGCLIDKDSLAFAYGKESKNKPIIGCTVIIDSIPHLIPMRLDNYGRWIGEL